MLCGRVCRTSLVIGQHGNRHGGVYGYIVQSGLPDPLVNLPGMLARAEPSTPTGQPSQETRPSVPPSAPTAAPPASSPTGTPAVVLDDQEVSGIVGKSVRSIADEDMGRIVDIIVNRDGHVRAAIIWLGNLREFRLACQAECRPLRGRDHDQAPRGSQLHTCSPANVTHFIVLRVLVPPVNEVRRHVGIDPGVEHVVAAQLLLSALDALPGEARAPEREAAMRDMAAHIEKAVDGAFEGDALAYLTSIYKDPTRPISRPARSDELSKYR